MKFSDKLNFDLNYTLQRTYDGADMDDALNNDGNSGGTGGGAFVDSRMARVPRHALGLNTYYRIPQKIYPLIYKLFMRAILEITEILIHQNMELVI